MSDFRFPEFDDLPTVQGQPKGCLWGFFDVDGEKDQLGTLRLLTEEVVRKAKDEIQTGVRVQLDWPLHNVEYPGFGRIPLQHDIKDLAEEGYVGFDDVITLNTQSSSQWDGLKHLSWWEHHNPGLEAPSPITCHKIPVSELEAALAFQGTELKQGDILIVRSGFVRWHNNAEASVRSLGTKERQYVIGLANNEETVRWLYSKHFSAVAGDTMGFEAWPFPEACCLHEWLLVQWGTPIGELWDLETLAEQCKTHKRWSFFLTSAPLRLVGGVASPPNAVAMF
ncbi:hypothetical protein NW756_009140 [Fusarium oxysporum]|nr:hypothetical protein NW753_013953 [Fusarium oxysporum]KAJ4084275.1 hypothetical protein NW756_009140 [Fusarium oxysporum]KAJ4107941.1 hypothetical protein NW769_008908 [Fusarium oxysporum]WKT49651.1 Kynurenine formamidase superfamily [Fusarium oxysporum f. sp. vasinfectum]